jgi:hypothetical protein
MPLVIDVNLRILSSTIATIVGPKGVLMHLGLFEFLTTTSKFAASVIICSSMKRSTVEEIVGYLFCGFPWPFDILG